MKCFKLSVLPLLCFAMIICATGICSGQTFLIGVTGARYASIVNEHSKVQFIINSSSVDTSVIQLFNGDGSSTPDSTITAFAGSSLPTVVIPQKTGWVFTGYYTAEDEGRQCYDQNGVGLVDYADLPITQNLYAHWVEEN